MKVLFVINPFVVGEYVKPAVPHIGIAYLSSMLLKHGHEVEVLDMRLNSDNKNLFRKIENFRPDFVGLTFPSQNYLSSYKLIDQLKERYNNIQLIVGGPHASLITDDILKETKADYAVMGEGEYTLLELAEGKHPSEIDGLIWRNNGTIIKNKHRKYIENLDELPFPAYDKFDLSGYVDKKIPISSSRGCPHQCIFCTSKQIHGARFRARSAENVVDEIELWYKKGYTYFQFAEDSFSDDVERAKKICDLIIQRRIKILWELRSGIRVDNTDEELFKKMKASGCFFVAFGVESVNPQVLLNIRKGITIEQVTKNIKWAKKHGIKTSGFFIIGNPGDTVKTFKETIDYVKSMDFDEVRFYNLIPFPKTPLFLWIVKNATFLYEPHVYLNDVSAFDTKPIFYTKDFSEKERIQCLRIGRQMIVKYFLESEFGKYFGKIGYAFWRIGIDETLGKKIYLYIRSLRK